MTIPNGMARSVGINCPSKISGSVFCCDRRGVARGRTPAFTVENIKKQVPEDLVEKVRVRRRHWVLSE